MNNKVSNPKVEVPQTNEMNDKDYINCLLSNLKEMEKGYLCAMIEASNEDLYNIYKDTLISLSDMQRMVYEMMFRNGWYVIEKIPVDKVNDKYNLLLKEYEDLEMEA